MGNHMYIYHVLICPLNPKFTEFQGFSLFWIKREVPVLQMGLAAGDLICSVSVVHWQVADRNPDQRRQILIVIRLDLWPLWLWFSMSNHISQYLVSCQFWLGEILRLPIGRKGDSFHCTDFGGKVTKIFFFVRAKTNKGKEKSREREREREADRDRYEETKQGKRCSSVTFLFLFFSIWNSNVQFFKRRVAREQSCEEGDNSRHYKDTSGLHPSPPIYLNKKPKSGTLEFFLMSSKFVTKITTKHAKPSVVDVAKPGSATFLHSI